MKKATNLVLIIKHPTVKQLEAFFMEDGKWISLKTGKKEKRSKLKCK